MGACGTPASRWGLCAPRRPRGPLRLMSASSRVPVFGLSSAACALRVPPRDVRGVRIPARRPRRYGLGHPPCVTFLTDCTLSRVGRTPPAMSALGQPGGEVADALLEAPLGSKRHGGGLKHRRTARPALFCAAMSRSRWAGTPGRVQGGGRPGASGCVASGVPPQRRVKRPSERRRVAMAVFLGGVA